MAIRKPVPQGMREVKVVIPQEVYDLLGAEAARLPSSKQALLAPLIRAFARGEIRQGYFLMPDEHGNQGRRKDQPEAR